ncbi:MAG: metallophosphoesterase family protein [Thermodesulfobacteriota bacterium]|nr:metallophosphoesterase family protein [Thermodesulfobacteriota bacterium]
MEKIFAIGDIHGCLSKLKKMLSLLKNTINREDDTLLFIGDYIDRGPDPKGVVDFVLDLRGKFSRSVFLLGNHEEIFLNYINHREDGYMFFMNGGDTTAASYGYKDTGDRGEVNVPEDHMEFFTTLLPYYETENYIFVHAGLRPGIPLTEQATEDLIWIRYEFIRSSYDFGKTVVFGHTPILEPLIEPNKIGIDTGAVYGGLLTCVELPSKKIYQV